jgi:hypothetical protein
MHASTLRRSDGTIVAFAEGRITRPIQDEIVAGIIALGGAPVVIFDFERVDGFDPACMVVAERLFRELRKVGVLQILVVSESSLLRLAFLALRTTTRLVVGVQLRVVSGIGEANELAEEALTAPDEEAA